MTSHDDITRLFAEIDRMPWGPAERELTARAVAMAVELGDEDLEYQARMRQTASANQGGDTDLLLSSFAWCLAKHDSDPARFATDINNGSADLMWHFKWMASTLRASPEFSAEQIAAVLDDMEAHYRTEGLGLSGVAMARFEDAWGAGRMAEAEKLRLVLEATPRDSHSHCDACGRSQFVGYFGEIGRDADAIRLVEEMIEGGFSCGEEPESALSRSLLPYLRAGRFDDAKRAHMRSYRLAQDNPDNLGMVATNLMFAAITGNEARALAMVERHIGWLTHDPLNVAGHARMLRAMGLALDAVTAAGHGDAVVRGAKAPGLEQFFGEHDGEWQAEELAAEAWNMAGQIGARFDFRNGTTAYADALMRDRALRDVRYDVPIHSDAFVAVTAAVAPQTADERLQRAFNLSDWGDAAAAVPALYAALADGDPRRAGDLHGLLVGALLATGRDDEAREHISLYAAARRAEGRDEFAAVIDELGLTLFGEGGDEGVAVMEAVNARTTAADARGLILSGIAHSLLQSGDFARALEAAQASHEAFVETGDAEDIVDSMTSVAFFAGLVGNASLALEYANAALESRVVSDGQRANLLETRARFRVVNGEFVEGAADADEASRLIASFGATMGAARLSVLSGALLEDAQRPLEAAARYRVALRQLERDGDDTAATRFRLARALLVAGNASEAVELLSVVYSDEEAAGVEPASRGETLIMLAEAFEVDEQPGNAVGAWNHAAELFEQADIPSARAHALSMTGRIYGMYGEHDLAMADLEKAVELARAGDDTLGLLVRSLHLLAQTYAAMGNDQAWAALDEAEQHAEHMHSDWLIADIADSRARALGLFDRTDEAIAEALRATDLYASAEDEASAAGSELFAGRLLAAADRRSEAVIIYQGILQRNVAGTPVHQVAVLELGDLWQSLGRHDKAAEVRSLIQR